MSKLTWLHISDWHQKGTAFDRKVVCDALIDDVKKRMTRISPDIGKIDFIVFSGDVAFNGKEEEYIKASECFIKPLLAAAGVSPKNLFIVPGNHDLDRDAFKYLPEKLKTPLTDKEDIEEWLSEGKPRNHLLEPFDCFERFVSAYEGNTFSALKLYTTQEPCSKRVALLGFNSALMSGRNKNSKGEIEDYGKLAVGEEQIYEKLQTVETRKSDLIIAVFHHPFRWLAEFDVKHVEQRIKQDVHFVLCGHQHQQKVEVTNSTDGNYVLIPAGAAYDRRDKDYANAYNFVHLDFTTNKGIAYLRCWSDGKSEWREDVDTAKTGKYEFQIPSKLKTETLCATDGKTDYAASSSLSCAVTPYIQYTPDNPVFNIPYRAKEEGVIGRDDALEKVRHQLLKGRRTAIGHTALFHGIGGLGKTQLAVEYAYKFRDGYPSGVIWISADQDIDAQLIRIAVDAKWISSDTKHADILAIAKQRLTTYSDCLIIFDNVENQAAIIPYLPVTTAEPHLLLTSRTAQPGFEPIALEFLNDELSFAMLMKESDREGNNLSYDEKCAAENIVGKLGGLPLAIEIAGAYLRYYPTCTFSRYYAVLEKNIKNALAGNMMASFTRHEQDLYRTLQVSESVFEKSPLLRNVLNLLAWSGTGFMGLSLMTSALKKSEEDLLEPVNLGVALRLLNKAKDSEERYEIHRLLRHVWQEQEPLTEAKREWVNDICAGVGAWFKKYREDFSKLKDFEMEINHLENWFEHAKKCNSPHIAFLKWLQAYPPYHKGDYECAHKLVIEAMRLMQKNAEAVDHELEANIQDDLGSTYGYLGNYKKALEYQNNALEMRKNLFGEEHADTAVSLNNVGAIYGKLGDYEKALEYEKKAFEIRKKLFGEEHADIAMSLNGIGATYDKLGDYEKALEYEKKAFEMRKKLFGEMYPATAISLNDVGVTYGKLGDCEEALEYQNKAFEIQIKLLGEMHPNSAMSLSNVGATYNELGDHEKALEYQNRALEIQKKLFGEMHPNIAMSLNNIGTTYASSRNYILAVEYCQRALNIEISLLGKVHPDTILTIRNMVSILCRFHKFNEAYQQVVEYFKDVPVDNDISATLRDLKESIDRKAQRSGFRPPSSKNLRHKGKKKRK
jgi:tetratricopeptide (TPR) repeat protein/predicted MPP superfamily phosphohydrolase